MTTLKTLQERMVKKFKEKFVRKSVFGVTIGAIDNFKGTAEKQVNDFLKSALATAVKEAFEETRILSSPEEYQKNAHSFGIDIVTQIEKKQQEFINN